MSSPTEKIPFFKEPPDWKVDMDLETESSRWYAIRTRSRAEKIVRDQLKGRAIEPFLPLATRISHWKDRKKAIEWALFPGYCFARFCHDQKRAVLHTPGVVEIVGSGNIPEAIPEEEIVALQQVVDRTHDYDSCSYLEEGMPVLVTRGLFAGIQGRLVRKADRCHLVLSIHLLHQSMAVHIDAHDVIPVHTACAAIPL